jgi:hypothetical protein
VVLYTCYMFSRAVQLSADMLVERFILVGTSFCLNFRLLLLLLLFFLFFSPAQAHATTFPAPLRPSSFGSLHPANRVSLFQLPALVHASGSGAADQPDLGLFATEFTKLIGWCGLVGHQVLVTSSQFPHPASTFFSVHGTGHSGKERVRRVLEHLNSDE